MKKISRKQWVSFGLFAVLYVLFCLWMENLWLLFGLIVLVDVFLTRFIPWGAWKKSNNPRVRGILEAVDDLLFALVMVYLIHLFVFQNYQIPSASLEKTLLVGDYLFVSKLSYGPRVPNTPLSFPLVQNTFPVLNSKSYIDWPEWGYKRVKGLGKVKRNDIVVFNFPTGDTVALKIQNPDYYYLIAEQGREAIHRNREKYGEVIYRPVDKRENYVKRCVGMPGDTLSIVDNQLYINSVAAKNPTNLQYNYYVETDGSMLTEDQFRALDVSRSDRRLVSADAGMQRILLYMGFTPGSSGYFSPIYCMPLTQQALERVRKISVVKQVKIEEDTWNTVFPINYRTGWTRDNFGPLWIPAKGATIPLNEKNLALYGRCIRNYELNTLEVTPDGKAVINGQAAATYTFRYDYYFMMGDNRHNSADSRSWGFVPEDHIVGKPILIWLSVDKDYSLFNGGIRWKRMFRTVDAD
ncbi:MAG: signal peptidase I [Tannerella sp.]|jgi:signal peptidase I|nr:signal peptidase I [Tannerella sp.]